MIDKRYPSLHDLLDDCPALHHGAVVLVAGFGDAGVPVAMLEALCERGLRDLTIVSNNAGAGESGLARLMRVGSVSRIVCSFPRSAGSVVFEELYDAGKLALEVVPQGTLAERLRAGGAGIPAFFTPTAYGTELAEGKETREFDGRHYVMERAIKGDVALVHAATGDRWGNLTYSKTARNFNPVMAMAATTTLAEVRQLVEVTPPEHIVTPGIFVQRLVELPR